MMQMGLDAEDWIGKPIIAIVNTWSEAQPCHMHFKERVVDEKRGITQAGGIARSYGHCMTMGTASTITAIAEAMGLTLPGASSIPAANVNHIRMSTACGRRIVDMVWQDVTPSDIITLAAVKNAATVTMARRARVGLTWRIWMLWGVQHQ